MKISNDGFIILSALLLIHDATGVVVANGATSNTDGSQVGSELKQRRNLIAIIPPPNNPQNLIVKRVGETLNLTCVIKYNETAEGENRSRSSAERGSDPTLAWYLPNTLQNSLQRTSVVENRTRGSLSVTVTNLKDTDSGTYACEARALDHQGNFDVVQLNKVEVTVKPKRNSCGEPSFACSTGECIPKRYVCDGRSDCKEGSDESQSTCGSYNPCDGKLRCEDGRCISRQWCCERSDPNCTTLVSPSCCKQLPMSFNLDVSQYPPQSQQFSDMGFLQTTIYTVIGCAMAFMFIITIMVIAICRVHLKRTNLPRYPHHLNQGTQRQDSWGNIFLHSSGGGLPYTSAASGLLVTYNINNGVQFVGRPVNPPPYSEIIRAPPREGPPPPYASHENIPGSSSPSPSPSPSLSPAAAAAAAGVAVSSGTTSPVVESSSAAAAAAAVQPYQVLRRSHLYASEFEPLAALEPLLPPSTSSENNNGDINGNSTSGVQVEPNCNLTQAPTPSAALEPPSPPAAAQTHNSQESSTSDSTTTPTTTTT